MAVTVRHMKPSDAVAWDHYVLAHPKGTFCHRAGWRSVIENGSKQKSYFLLAEEDDTGNIVGILPLAHRKSLLFGSALVSTLFAVYGGPLADTDDIKMALDDFAWQQATLLGAASLEYRTEDVSQARSVNWQTEAATSATFRKSLKNTPEDILLDIPRKQRAVVRKSLKHDLTCSWEKNLDGFYKLYAESVRNLGTPVFPKGLFSQFMAEFGDDVDIQVIYTPEGAAVASLMSFYHGDWVLPYYAGGNLSARKYGAHDFMYYQLMLRAAERGKTGFDFGRSKIGTGPYKFKKNWGFEPKILAYQSRLADGAVKSNLNPNSAKYRLMTNLWKKLPLPIANMIGPHLARHLG